LQVAVANCLNKGMALLSVASEKEWTTISNIYTGTLHTTFIKLHNQHLKTKTIDIKSIGLTFWTSGSNEGEFCNTLNVYGWCSALNKSLLLPEFLAANKTKFWSNATAANPETDRCLAFNFNKTKDDKVGFIHQQCNATNNYICEVCYI